MYKFLVGNKCDLVEKRKVSYEQAKEFADQYGLKYMETSAKSAENVSDAFITMTKEIIASNVEKEKAISHTANILGRTFEEILDIYDAFGSAAAPDRFLHVIYWLGKLAIEEIIENNKRTITFSPVLRERLGHHIHGEIWATKIKEVLKENNLS